jgi:heterodisulfide reductase subunit C
MKILLTPESVKSDFLKKIEETTKQKVFDCYQCGKCSAGCPISFEMDHLPNAIIRMAQFGMEKEVLKSRSIWLCASCETCTTRCPREIDIAALMDGFRILAVQKGIRPRLRTVRLFNKLFLGIVKKYGRIFEGELIGKFNMFSGKFFQDVLKAPILLKQGRLKIFPAISNRKAIRKIFKGVKQKEKQQTAKSKGQRAKSKNLL